MSSWIRMLLYNSWKINHSLLKKAKCAKLKKSALTLNQNKDMLARKFLSLERKSHSMNGAS
ncbi:MAG: hypothetical protein ACTSQJ_09490 [Promethearchaeota archaeon]